MRNVLLLMIGVAALVARPAATTAQPGAPEGPVEATVIGIATLDIAALWDAPVFADARATLLSKAKRFEQMMTKSLGLKPEQVQRFTVVMFKCSGNNYEALDHVHVVTARQPVDVTAFEKATGAKRVVEKGKYAGLPEVAVYETEHIRLAVSGSRLVMLEPLQTYEMQGEKYVTIKKPPPGEAEMIAKALKRDDDRAAVMAKDAGVFSVTMDVTELARLFQGTINQFTGEAEPLPAPLADLAAAKFLLGGVTLAGKADLKFELTFATPEAAATGKVAMETVKSQVQRLIERELALEGAKKPDGVLAELGKFAIGLLEAAKVTQVEKAVTAKAGVEFTKDLANTLVKGVLAAENAATRSASQNNLKQIALGCLNYESAVAAGLLQNINDAKGKPLLSWRVQLLPYLDQEELYKQFKLDEPWDSDHNKPLIAKMPKVFEVPTIVPAKEGQTFYQAFVGKKGQAVRPLLQEGAEPLKISGVSDGTTNTILVAEAAEAVVWTKPEDLPFDAEGKLPKLGGHFDDGLNVAMADGSTRFLRCGAMPDANWETILKSLITANGGETVALDDN